MEKVPFLVLPWIAEVGSIPENRGRPSASVVRDLGYLPQVHALDFSEVDAMEAQVGRPFERRSHDRESNEKAMEMFRVWLRGRREKCIVLVGHNNVMQALIGDRSARFR